MCVCVCVVHNALWVDGEMTVPRGQVRGFSGALMTHPLIRGVGDGGIFFHLTSGMEVFSNNIVGMCKVNLEPWHS